LTIDHLHQSAPQQPCYTMKKYVGKNFGKSYNKPLSPVAKSMWFVYVLKCENDCFYIGIALNVKERYEEHVNGRGSDFTKDNKPIKIIKRIKTNTSEKGLAEVFENYHVIEYGKKYGAEKVGGGSFRKKGILKKKIQDIVKKSVTQRLNTTLYK